MPPDDDDDDLEEFGLGYESRSPSQAPSDGSFEELLDAYLDPPAEPNLRMAGVCVVWVDDDPNLGALHMATKHGVSKEEVHQVLFEVPPLVEAKRSKNSPERTIFWGAARNDRWLFIVCEDWVADGVRNLKPITAFEPDDGVDYWRAQ